LGVPTEGSKPAPDSVAFIEKMPKAEGKKAILFCTYRIWKGSTLKILEKELAAKGYQIVLSVSKKGMKPDKEADFSKELSEIQKALAKL
jgi:hypothetical protein